MSESLITIEIDGRPCEARPGAMLIEVTDAAGISVPRFCYHEKLSIAANCRMCLVEVANCPKPLPACATPVTAGMKVYTRSPKAIAAQRGTMEFLLINHPLDCPICDQGGECELQDLALGYGRDVSRFAEKKRVVDDQDIGPLVATEMTRCIHCTRCVRFGAEIAGVRELGALGRGENTRIGTCVDAIMDSEVSGNVIDLCPVGALTSKPFRYTARAWELEARDSVAPHDSLGSNVRLHVRRGRVMRVVPNGNEAINETWLSDRDRFGYEGLNHPDRLREPRVRVQGGWRTVEWDVAIDQAVGLIREGIAAHGPQTLGALVSPQCTTEEHYLAQRLVRALGSGNIDCRLRQADFRDQDDAPLFPSPGLPVADLERIDAGLVVGSNLRKEQPLLALRLRRAAAAGARIALLNPVAFDVPFTTAANLACAPQLMVTTLAGVLVAACRQTGSNVPERVKGLCAGVEPDAAQSGIASALAAGSRPMVLLGAIAALHPDGAALRALAAALAHVAQGTWGVLPAGANEAGGWLAGAVPHRRPGGTVPSVAGRDVSSMLREGGIRTWLLMGIEPDRDLIDGAGAMAALGGSAVVALTAYAGEALAECAQVMLPIAPFSETDGTFVNMEGRWQSFAAAVPCAGQARPAWKVLRRLAERLGVDDFAWTSTAEIIAALRGALPKDSPVVRPNGPTNGSWKPEAGRLTGPLVRLGDVPIHAVDAIVRRADALQRTRDAMAPIVRLNARDAARLRLSEGGSVRVRQGANEAVLPFAQDARVPEGCVWLPAGDRPTCLLGPGIGPVEVEPA